ncbi:MAG: hypothetical protein ACLQF2_15635 [Rhodomicrobium sp.]
MNGTLRKIQEPLAPAPSPHAKPASPHIEIASPHVTSRASPHKGAVARNLKWRAKNLDRHRAYHREYMRKWRAEARATEQAPADLNE